MTKVSLFSGIFLGALIVMSASVYAEKVVTPVTVLTAEEYVHLGNVSGKKEKYKEAVQNYTKAIEEDPHLANAYYNRAYVYIELRKYKKAIADLDLALEIDPKYAAAYHVRGIAYFFKKKYDQAISDYSKAIELDPKNIRYYTSRMSVYFKMANSDKAWQDVMNIQKLGGTVNPAIINILKGRKYRE
jgi:tetratricopeptide (TPR) repeat protein